MKKGYGYSIKLQCGGADRDHDGDVLVMVSRCSVSKRSDVEGAQGLDGPPTVDIPAKPQSFLAPGFRDSDYRFTDLTH